MRQKAGAFSLVEVCLALGVAVFALVAIFALLPVGIVSNQTSIQQSTAINIATAVAADLRQVPAGASSTVSSRYQVDVTQPSFGPVYLDDSGTVVAQNLGRFKMTVKLTQPTGGARNATRGNITIAWPAGSTNPSHSVSTFIALDRN